MQGLLGKKIGMTQVFNERGHSLPVTVLEVGPCVVVQLKTRNTDGYDAVQIGFDDAKESRITKSAMGRFKKAGVTVPKRFLKEFNLEDGDAFKQGDSISVSIFDGVSHVDITGITKGRGFTGVVKRHRMAGGPKTHGSGSHRRVGSIGQCSYPARVAKGQRMPGHYGHVTVTQQNLKLVGIKGEDNVLLVRGAVPGPDGGLVVVRKSIKKSAVSVKACSQGKT